MRLVLSRALEEELLDHRAMLEPLTVERLVRALPAKLVTKVIERAISDGSSASPFTYEAFLDVVTTDNLVEHIELPVLWNDVVVPKIARACDLLTEGDATRAKAKASADKLVTGTAAAPKSASASAPATESAPASASSPKIPAAVTGAPVKKNGATSTAAGKAPAKAAPPAVPSGKSATSAKAPTPGTSATAGKPATAGSNGTGLDINDDVFNELGSDSDLSVETDVDVIDDVIDELSDDLGRSL
ncbi:MAG: hypothetical protein B7733_12150 [Myxococcales bacterium FL481]|nr:MAG: hypothetical protein B7733_12150 [Myxococcales bacterium FL481]